MKQRHVLHLYWRAGFGLKPKELLGLSKLSKKNVVDNLFKESQSVVPLSKDLSYLKSYPQSVLKNNKEKRKELLNKNRKETRILNTIWLKRLETTPRVLRERMTLFWANHFVCKDF